MKTIVLLALVAVASAQLGATNLGGAAGGVQGAPGAAAPGAVPAANPYGPKVYGPGLNNPFAFPHNPFLVRQAEAVANTNPNLFVRVETDGGWEFTNRFGEKVDVYNAFGQELD
ncbi:uncharacterized protein [Procambarus clarkii]|uniref:uncharacterized protein n=1 Tax=Procambarus clarkii TaxID=6728 RepID=UPI001E672DD8|nr:uncharacterized protein LOC123745242 [Procambarus clarkii]